MLWFLSDGKRLTANVLRPTQWLFVKTLWNCREPENPSHDIVATLSLFTYCLTNNSISLNVTFPWVCPLNTTKWGAELLPANNKALPTLCGTSVRPPTGSSSVLTRKDCSTCDERSRGPIISNNTNFARWARWTQFKKHLSYSNSSISALRHFRLNSPKHLTSHSP